MRKLIVVVLCLCLLALPAAWTAGQPADPIRLEISTLVSADFPRLNMTANVYDDVGQPVLGLTRDNFELLGDLRALTRIVSVENVTDDNLPFATVLVIDVSLSMDGTPLERARAAALAFIDSLRPDDPVALVAFSTRVTVLTDFTTDRDLLRSRIESLEPVGQTALYQAAFESIELAAQSSIPRRAVILLSDGGEFGGHSRVGREDGIARALTGGVPVYTIGLGFGADRTYLEALSSATNARTYESPTADDLDLIYRDLAARFRSQYVLTLETAAPGDGTTYDLGLRVNAPAGSALASAAFRAPIPVPIVRLSGLPETPIDAPASLTIEVVADDRLASVTFDEGVGERPLVDFASPYTLTIDPRALPPGQRTLTVRATDADGDSGSAELPIAIAALPPVIRFDNLLPGETLRENRVVTLSFETQTPVIHTAILIDGEDYAHRIQPPFEFEIDVLELGVGDHIVRVIADNAGGANATADLAFRVDASIGVTLTALVPTSTPTPTTTPTATASPTPTATPTPALPEGQQPGSIGPLLPVVTGIPATDVPGQGVPAEATGTAQQIALAVATADAQATADLRALAEAAAATGTFAAEASAQVAATRDARATTAANAMATVQAGATLDARATAAAGATLEAIAAQITAVMAATETQSAQIAAASATAAIAQTQLAQQLATLEFQANASATAAAEMRATQGAVAATQTAVIEVQSTRVAAAAMQATQDAQAAAQTAIAAQATQNAQIATQTAIAAQATQSAQIATQTAIAAQATQNAQAAMQAAIAAQATQNAQAAAQTAIAQRATQNAQIATQTAIAAQATQNAQIATQTAIAAQATQNAQIATQTAIAAQATQNAQAATQTAIAAQATQNAQATANALLATQTAIAQQATQAAQATANALLATQTVAAQQATQNALATANALLATQTSIAATQTAQAAADASATLDAIAASRTAEAAANASATAAQATRDALATRSVIAATQTAAAASATALIQATLNAALTSTADAAATLDARATAETDLTQTAIAAATNAVATDEASTLIARVTQTAISQATQLAAPSLAPSLTPTLEIQETQPENPPTPNDLLPLTCVIGGIAGVMAVIFILIGGSQRRRRR